jgi:hypothetical protein
MKNHELDQRVRAFFAAAPRPAAPDSLWRLPATVVSAGPDRERVRAPGVFGVRRWTGLGLAGLVVAGAVAVTVGVRMAGPGVGPSASPTAPVSSPMVPPASSSASAPLASPAALGPAYAMGGLAWQEVGVGTFDGVEDLAFFPLDQGLLAVGTSRTAQTRLWLTTDGSDFQVLDASAFQSDDPVTHQIRMNGLVKGPAGYVAVGALVTPAKTEAGAGEASPLVWRSADGLRWSRISTKGLPAGGMGSVVSTSTGYVAAVPPFGSQTSYKAFPVFSSADGVSWQATSIVATQVVSHAGHIVALTVNNFDASATDNFLAVTDDGSKWTTPRLATRVTSVTAGPDGFVATTYDQAATKMSVIRSSDGRIWTNAGEASDLWAGPLAYAMGSWVMLASPDGVHDWPRVLTSSDAVTWQSGEIPFQVFGAAMPGGRLTALRDGFLTATQAEIGPGSMTAYGPLQVHLWWVRTARPGDAPGSPAPTFPPVTTPSGGITEAQAISIAAARYPKTMTDIYAKLVTIGGFDPKQTLVPADRPVWAVMVVVAKPGCSGKAPGPSPCDLPYTPLTVIVDYYTGDIIEVIDNSK